jgi:hypothetical protein
MGASFSAAVHAAVLWLWFREGYGSHSFVQPRRHAAHGNYLPNGGAASLYESITPVNSFRVVLNHYFETRYSMLPDRSYRASYQDPFRFEDVTAEIEAAATVGEEKESGTIPALERPPQRARKLPRQVDTSGG